MNYLITYAWRRIGCTHCGSGAQEDFNFATAITEKHPAHWLLDTVREAKGEGLNEDYHIINTTEIHEDLAEIMKEYIG